MATRTEGGKLAISYARSSSMLLEDAYTCVPKARDTIYAEDAWYSQLCLLRESGIVDGGGG